MPNDALLHVRIDSKTKNKIERFAKRFGLSTSDGVRMLINQGLQAKEILLVPNDETQKAIDDDNLQEISLTDLSKMILGDK